MLIQCFELFLQILALICLPQLNEKKVTQARVIGIHMFGLMTLHITNGPTKVNTIFWLPVFRCTPWNVHIQ